MLGESRCHELASLVMDAESLVELDALSAVFSQAVLVRRGMLGDKEVVF